LTVSSTVSLTIAQASQPATGPTSRPAPGFMDALSGPFFPLLLGIIVLYFFMYRSKRNQERQLKDQLGQMKRGDRVMTAGGILGKIVEVEDSKVLVKVDENSNTKIWFTRDAIRRVLTEEKAEAAK
jgi:preprotein translocase subunit YajC